jgi:hypothetical protein
MLIETRAATARVASEIYRERKLGEPTPPGTSPRAAQPGRDEEEAGPKGPAAPGLRGDPEP